MPTLTFGGSRALDPHRNYRAFAEVQVLGAAGTTVWRNTALVDSGSDHTILPLAALSAAGVAKPGGPSVTVWLADGSTAILASHPVLPVIIEGWSLSLRGVLFSSAARFVPILGRLDLLRAFGEFAIDTTDWHWP